MGLLLRRLAGFLAGGLLGLSLVLAGHPLNPFSLGALLVIGVLYRQLRAAEHSTDGIWCVGLGVAVPLLLVGLPQLALPECTDQIISACADARSRVLTIAAISAMFLSLVLGVRDRTLWHSALRQ